jgi:acetate kinase
VAASRPAAVYGGGHAMNVLALNCGSSTLKFKLIDVGEGRSEVAASGMVDDIGGASSLALRAGGQTRSETATVADHGDAARLVLGWLASIGCSAGQGIDAVGHRVVHGGERFREATEIDDGVVESIEAVSRLAPLHNVPALAAIRATREKLGSLPAVAAFDTSLHRTLPERAARYAIPGSLADRHGIRRFGFHGLAHGFMAERHAALVSRPLEQTRVVTLQLGNGCSATAIRGGRSIDTSMGLTPLEGLVMGTRSGDVDPSLAGFLARCEGVDVEEIEDVLNKRSGLLGVSERSRDMRELLQAEAERDPRASLAIEMFCYRARKYVGAYLAALGGADAVIFGGGIGEHAPAVRARICAGMQWCGLLVDDERNEAAIGSEARISPPQASIEVYVIPVDEELIIARLVASCLASSSRLP